MDTTFIAQCRKCGNLWFEDVHISTPSYHTDLAYVMNETTQAVTIHHAGLYCYGIVEVMRFIPHQKYFNHAFLEGIENGEQETLGIK